MIPIADAVTPDTYVGIQTLRQYLFDEVHYKLYHQGKGNYGSPARALRGYGFKSKRKDKLLKEVTQYLNTVTIVEVD